MKYHLNGLDYALPTLFRLLIIVAMFSLAQPISASIWGSRECVHGVNAYSTRGGTSGYTVRVTYPSSSSVRKVTVSIFCDMSGISRCNSLKRIGPPPVLFRVYMTKRDHLSHNRASIFRIGQSGNSASSIVVLSIICCNTNCYTKVIKFPKCVKELFFKKIRLQSAYIQQKLPPGK